MCCRDRNRQSRTCVDRQLVTKGNLGDRLGEWASFIEASRFTPRVKTLLVETMCALKRMTILKMCKIHWVIVHQLTY